VRGYAGGQFSVSLPAKSWPVGGVGLIMVWIAAKYMNIGGWSKKREIVRVMGAGGIGCMVGDQDTTTSIAQFCTYLLMRKRW